MNFITNLQDKILSKRILSRLQKIDQSEWIRIGHAFNHWDFPVEFYKLRPNWWDAGDRAFKVINPVFDAINRRFTEKEKLRYHNVHVGKMTNDEFEHWFKVLRSMKGIEVYYNRRTNVQQIKWWEDDVYKKLVDAGLCK